MGPLFKERQVFGVLGQCLPDRVIHDFGNRSIGFCRL